ncbi:MAG: hypothetical protein GTN71_08825 [Anaerolineae bacterium]|nr:hypothetical protein [Anaerolineae bacterium]
MDPITTSIVIILGKYALDKGVELGKEVGPTALEKAKEMFGIVLEHVKGVAPRTAQKFPENPEGYKAPLTDALDEAVQADADLAAKLKALLEEYEAAAKEHAAAMGTRYQAILTGSGAIAQGPGATAAGASGVAVGGDVQGRIHLGRKEKDE